MAKKKKITAAKPQESKPKNPCPVCGQGLYSDNDLLEIDRGKMKKALAKATGKYGGVRISKRISRPK